MTRKHEIVKDCDRCARQRRATETVTFAYDGNEYEIDLCDQHSEMLDRDMHDWTRLARETQSAFNKQKTMGLSHVERQELHRRRIGSPPAPTAPVVDISDDVVEYEANELSFDIWPTEAAIAAMTANGIEWPTVVAGVRHHLAVVPSDRPDVSCYIAKDLKILLSEDHHVLGVSPRDPGEALPAQKTGPQTTKIVRKGKRGGIGNVGPRDYGDILKAIKEADGWTLEQGGKHYKLTGPDGQTATIPVTPSDWRSSLNVVSQLRALGLNLRETATRTTQSA